MCITRKVAKESGNAQMPNFRVTRLAPMLIIAMSKLTVGSHTVRTISLKIDKIPPPTDTKANTEEKRYCQRAEPGIFWNTRGFQKPY